MNDRATGILMERHALEEQEALKILRDHSRLTGRKLVDVAAAVVDSHLVLPAQAWRPDAQFANTAVD